MDIVSNNILEAVKDISFGCAFLDGSCVGRRKRLGRGFKDIGKICCRGCFHNVGYLRIKAEELPSEYKILFIHPGGFWREGGCILPKEMRSRRCTIYSCRDSLLSKTDRDLLKEFERTT